MTAKRLFVAIPLPIAIKEALFDSIEPYKKMTCLKNSRWVNPENLHITTLFLGDVPDEDIPQIQMQIHTKLAKIESFDLLLKKSPLHLRSDVLT